jgi:hypothetical protein
LPLWSPLAVTWAVWSATPWVFELAMMIPYSC